MRLGNLSARRLWPGILERLWTLRAFLAFRSKGRHVGSQAPEMKGNFTARTENSQGAGQARGGWFHVRKPRVPPLPGLSFHCVKAFAPLPCWLRYVVPPGLPAKCACAMDVALELHEATQLRYAATHSEQPQTRGWALVSMCGAMLNCSFHIAEAVCLFEGDSVVRIQA